MKKKSILLYSCFLLSMPLMAQQNHASDSKAQNKALRDSLAAATNVLAYHPDSATAFAARGGMEREKNQLELAEYDYAKAMQLDAQNSDYVINHLDLLILLDRKNEAYDDIGRLQKMGFKSGQLQDFYARLRKKKK